MIPRTLTVFWLFHLNIAIQVYERTQKFSRDLKPAEFKQVLLCSPWLADEKLANEFYSDGLLSAETTRNFWRHPDLRALAAPSTAMTPKETFRQVSLARRGDGYRLARFALPS